MDIERFHYVVETTVIRNMRTTVYTVPVLRSPDHLELLRRLRQKRCDARTIAVVLLSSALGYIYSTCY